MCNILKMKKFGYDEDLANFLIKWVKLGIEAVMKSAYKELTMLN